MGTEIFEILLLKFIFFICVANTCLREIILLTLSYLWQYGLLENISKVYFWFFRNSGPTILDVDTNLCKINPIVFHFIFSLFWEHELGGINVTFIKQVFYDVKYISFTTREGTHEIDLVNGIVKKSVHGIFSERKILFNLLKL